jgi:small-conductance mechanosensitive channel
MTLERFLEFETYIVAVRLLATVAVALVLVKLVAYLVGKAVEKRISRQSMMLIKKAILYTGIVGIIMMVLSQLGLNLAAILGAFGVAGIAIGFAAQTSVSNVISGMFLISEKSFEIGDVINVNGNAGIVLSVDLLSVKIRTFDNQYIRIPNETMIKSEMINVTRFPIRRLNFEFTVSFASDLAVVKKTLNDLVAEIPECLDNPEPLFVIRQFGPRGVDLLFGVWFTRDNFLIVKNAVLERIKTEFNKAGIEIPAAGTVAVQS